jgi:hypothetical protein
MSKKACLLGRNGHHLYTMPYEFYSVPYCTRVLLVSSARCFCTTVRLLVRDTWFLGVTFVHRVYFLFSIVLFLHDRFLSYDLALQLLVCLGLLDNFTPQISI